MMSKPFYKKGVIPPKELPATQRRFQHVVNQIIEQLPPSKDGTQRLPDPHHTLRECLRILYKETDYWAPERQWTTLEDVLNEHCGPAVEQWQKNISDIVRNVRK